MNYLVFMSDGCQERDDSLDNLEFMIWRPGPFRIVPLGMSVKFALLWLAHYCRMFRNRNYCVLYIMDGKRIMHRSCIIPAVFRFPFMGRDDLQISSTWTEPDCRGRGLATIALRKCVQLMSKPGRNIWYISREANLPSIAVCEKAGFVLAGRAKRTRRFGLRMLGSFKLDNQEDVK